MAMVDKVRQHPSNPGTLSLADLAAYQPKRALRSATPPAPRRHATTASAASRRRARARWPSARSWAC